MSILGEIFGLGASLFNTISTSNNNALNRDYAKAMTEAQWERDDTSYQRSVEDAVKAGFSPLAVLDGGLIGNSSALAYQGQAPQLDVNAMMSALLQRESQEWQSSENSKRHNEKLKELKTEYQNSLNLAKQELENDKERITYELDETVRIQDELNKKEISKAQQLKQIEQLKELGIVKTQTCKDEAEASTMYTAWVDKYVSYVESYKSYTYSSTSSDTEKAGSTLPVVNAEAQASSSQTYQQTSISFSEYLQEFYYENPMPLNPDGTIPYFVGSKSDRNR